LPQSAFAGNYRRMRKAIAFLFLSCLFVAQAGCRSNGPLGRFARKPQPAASGSPATDGPPVASRSPGASGSRAEQKRPADWESAVLAEWDKERPDDREWRDLRSLNKVR